MPPQSLLQNRRQSCLWARWFEPPRQVGVVANLEWDHQRRVWIWRLLTTGQTSSSPQTTPVVVSKGDQKVPRMDSSPMAEVCLGGTGGGDRLTLGNQGIKGGVCPSTVSGMYKSKGQTVGLEKEYGFWLFMAQVAILSGPQISCVTFASHLSFLGLDFLICKMRM